MIGSAGAGRLSRMPAPAASFADPQRGDHALSATAHTPRTGLILTGGGARAAYQVGVLAAIAQLRRDAGVQGPNPFPVIAGTSAGAINAATLACQADEFDAAVDGLMHIWRNIHVDQVYAADSLGVIRTGARWMTMMSLGDRKSVV